MEGYEYVEEYLDVQEGVMIATASTAPSVSWEYTVSLLQLRYPAKVFRMKQCEYQGLDWGRNDLVQNFLGSSCLWLLLLSDIAVVHPDTIERLVSWNQPVVSALSVQREPPHSPAAYQEVPRNERFFEMPQGWMGTIRDWVIKYPAVLTSFGTPVVVEPRPVDALVEVRSGSVECILIDRDVLLAIGRPWFEYEEPFHKKVRDAGFKCYVDRSVVAGHIRSGMAGLLDFAVWDPIVKYSEEGQDG